MNARVRITAYYSIEGKTDEVGIWGATQVACMGDGIKGTPIFPSCLATSDN